MITHEAFFRVLDFLGVRKGHYTRTFKTPDGHAVLHDLAKFCRAHETTFHEDPRIHAALEGRREVWLRIQQHLNLTSAELTELYTGENPENYK